MTLMRGVVIARTISSDIKSADIIKRTTARIAAAMVVEPEQVRMVRGRTHIQQQEQIPQQKPSY
jgi:hypothetical protein